MHSKHQSWSLYLDMKCSFSTNYFLSVLQMKNIIRELLSRKGNKFYNLCSGFFLVSRIDENLAAGLQLIGNCVVCLASSSFYYISCSLRFSALEWFVLLSLMARIFLLSSVYKIWFIRWERGKLNYWWSVYSYCLYIRNTSGGAPTTLQQSLDPSTNFFYNFF